MSSTKPRPVHRMAPAERRAHAEQFVGLLAAVVVDGLRGSAPLDGDDPSEGRSELRGRILSVATPLVGTVADVLVIRHRGESGRLIDYAVSLATVESITPA